MASDELSLAFRPDVLALPNSEGITSHGVIQLGLTTNDKGLVFSRVLKIIHEASLPPQLELALETQGFPSWCPSLAITPLGSPVPAPPGPVGVGPTPLPGVFKLGLPPVVGTAPPQFEPPLIDLAPGFPPVPLLLAQTAVATSPLGTFAHFSIPGCVHTFNLSGSVLPALAPSVYSYSFYVSACPYAGPLVPPVGGTRIGMVSIVVNVQGAGFP